ncbi:NADH dehydrogenase [ubiquinone] 1 alpha subcomplex subunit 8 [Bombyx mori]|uniref:NADH dehydrogenase [ubiquinone] 1 alpha subcomplex subunit 8 n=1 Tax=Bombyx mori TaxID=7091 RepID=A0A8R2RAU1_BOMMO|nr:NADH dehydrogenase [ubiquinone] 1 alpha subcomplex subunit 8-like [Bombyx mori]
MVLTAEVDLPQFSTLTVPEVNLSTSTLMSAAPYLGKHCESINNEFMLCRQETNDPRSCLELGKRVTACTLQLFKNMKKACLHEFKQYANCIDKSSGDYGFRHCRKTQAVLDCCMKDKLGLERPHVGHFCRGRVHKSSCAPPRPPPCPCQPIVPDPTPSLPDSKPRYPPRLGSRFYFMTE